MPRAVDAITDWGRAPEPHVVFARDVASLMLAVDDPALLALHHSASLVLPDGMPLVWIAKLRGYGAKVGRVAGSDLVDAICRASLQTGQSHYFYGGQSGAADEMVRRLTKRYPGLKIAGTLTPPMRSFESIRSPDAHATDEFDTIRKANPDFIWVGISSPKQEWWMSRAAPAIGRGVFLGVGAAFDFQAGRVRRAPTWMQRIGLEWLHRLASEPRRLWRRYLVLAPRFVLLVLRSELRRRGSQQETD